MSKLLEGYYKTVNNFYELLKVIFKVKVDNPIILSLKVEKGKITVRDGMGHDYTMTVEYGDFGKSFKKENTKKDEWILFLFLLKFF